MSCDKSEERKSATQSTISEERAHTTKVCEEIKADMDNIVRMAVANVDSDEIHDFDVAIGNYVIDLVLARLG